MNRVGQESSIEIATCFITRLHDDIEINLILLLSLLYLMFRITLHY
jgi:hypothetical protein